MFWLIYRVHTGKHLKRTHKEENETDEKSLPQENNTKVECDRMKNVQNQLTMEFIGLNPCSGSTGAWGWKNVSPIWASLLFLIPQTTNPTWPANLEAEQVNMNYAF